MYTSVRNGPEVPPGTAEPGDAAERPGGKKRLAGVGGTVVAMGMVSFLTDASAEMVTAVLPLFLILQIGLTPLQYGVVDGVYQGVTVLVRLAGGYVADRWRRPKLVCAAGYGLSAVSKLGLLGVGSATSTSLVLAVDRTGKGIRTAPRDAVIAASTRPGLLGRAFGVHRALDTAGAMLGPLLAFLVLLAVPGGFHSVFVVSFCVAVVGVAVLVVFVPDVRWQAPPGAAKVAGRAVAGLLKDRRLVGLTVAAGLLGLVTVSDGFVYLSLQHRLQVPAEVFPLFLLGTSSVYLVLAIPLGRLADRVGRARVFLGGHVGLVLLYLLLLTGAVPAWLACGGALALLGTYDAATDGVLSAGAAEILPPALRSSGLALVQSALAGGRLLSSLLFGLLWTVTGGQRGGLAAFTVGLVVVLPIAMRLLRTKARVAA
ncbi:MAG TPA: MFS transporter [Mycobacteriales bacterium]